MKYDQAGTYEIEYKAIDECGNETTETRTVNVVAPVYHTVLYADGTLIINEDERDRDANTALYGAVTKEYAPGPYAFANMSDIPWYEERRSVLAIKFGSSLKQTTCARLFNQLFFVTTIDLTALDTSECTDFSRMFSGCNRLATVNTEKLDVSSATTMQMMFYDAFKVGNVAIDISTWDTANLTNTNQMFANATRLKTIYASDSIVTGNVSNSGKMFDGCTNLVGGNGTAYDSSVVDKTYARIDKAGQPGYFTDKE